MEINIQEILAKHWTNKYPTQKSGYEGSLFKIHEEWVNSAIKEIITEVLKEAGKEVYNMPMKQEERLVCEGFITSTINKVKF